MKKKDESIAPAKPPTVLRSVKHAFTPPEIAKMNTDFRLGYAELSNAEADFEAIKTSHKAKVKEIEARMGSLDSKLNAGFEMRDKEVVVVLRVADGKKDFYLADGFEPFLLELKVDDARRPVALLTEDMTPSDYEQELILAERAFDCRREFQIWGAGNDRGVIVVGKIKKNWFSALRGNVGSAKIEERLDGEQRAFKNRADAVKVAGERAMTWLAEKLGPDSANGFADELNKAVVNEMEKAE